MSGYTGVGRDALIVTIQRLTAENDRLHDALTASLVRPFDDDRRSAVRQQRLRSQQRVVGGRDVGRCRPEPARRRIRGDGIREIVLARHEVRLAADEFEFAREAAGEGRLVGGAGSRDRFCRQRG